MLERTSYSTTAKVISRHFLRHMNFNTGFNDHQCKQCEMLENPLSRRFKHAPDVLVESVRNAIFDHLCNLILYAIGEKVIRSEEDIIAELEQIGETKIHQWMWATKRVVNQCKTSKPTVRRLTLHDKSYPY